MGCEPGAAGGTFIITRENFSPKSRMKAARVTEVQGGEKSVLDDWLECLDPAMFEPDRPFKCPDT